MSFDIVNYSTTARRVVDDDVDYSAFQRTPLPEAALRAVQYMSDVESHTICYLRDLLVTPSHQDPEITTFLTMWVYEEFWHGEVLDKVLAAHGRNVGPDRIRRIRLAQGRGDRLSPWRSTPARRGSGCSGRAPPAPPVRSSEPGPCCGRCCAVRCSTAE